MGSRSRRRERGEQPASPSPPPPPSRPRERPAAYARSEARNEEVRRNLEPLGEGERPTAVTVAAILALVLALANVATAVAGVDIQGDEQSALSFTVLSTAILLAAAAGMWRAKYWAVLGFQCVLGFQIVLLALALTRVEKAWAAVLITALVAGLGFLFWKLVRAMARIQMPAR